MPRKGLRPRDRRGLPPADFKYNSVLVSRLINKLNYRGQKHAAESIMYGAMDIMAERAKEDALNVLTKAIENVRPLLEVKARRVGGATYQVPVELRPRRATTLSIRWLVGYSRQRRERTMALRLANEILDASNGVGATVKRKEDLHKMAESNKAFAHYRW